MIGVDDHQYKVDMCRLNDNVADPDGVKLGCCREAALDDRLTQGIG